ncbi:MAG: pyridoxamine 5'-phosphate oxidase family protein [Chloroflexota bacterium]
MPAPRSDRPEMPGYGVSEKRRGLLPWRWAEERLVACHNYYLATTRASGRPHSMPVWGVFFGGKFYFSTGVDSAKARNLHTNPWCVITTDDASEAVILEGHAKKATAKAVLQRFVRVYKQKYDWEMDPNDGSIWVVQPAKVFAFKEAADDFSTSATRWIF